MQKLILGGLILLSSITYAQKKVQGNGNVITIIRQTNSYDQIICYGSFDYILVKGIEGTISLKGEENLLEHIETYVKGNELIVKPESYTSLSQSNNKGIVITIPFTDIDKVSLTGSGDIHNEDRIETPSFTASVTGSGDAVLNVTTQHTEGSVTGSGDLTFKGATEILDVSVTGSGDFHGSQFSAQIVNVGVIGSGDAKVSCNEKLTARVSGSGDIEVLGNPKYQDTKVSGSGSIEIR